MTKKNDIAGNLKWNQMPKRILSTPQYEQDKEITLVQGSFLATQAMHGNERPVNLTYCYQPDQDANQSYVCGLMQKCGSSVSVNVVLVRLDCPGCTAFSSLHFCPSCAYIYSEVSSPKYI